MRRQLRQLAQHLDQLVRHALGLLLAGHRADGPAEEDERNGTWRCRHAVILVVLHVEPAVFEHHLDVLCLQLFAVLVSQDRQQQLVAHLLLERAPVDVEEVGVARGVAVLEHVLPPDRVPADAHVVGHNVQQQAHAMLAQCLGKGREALRTAQLWVQPIMPRDVVPMHAPRARLEDRRGIEVAHAQPLQVGNDRRRLVEGEPLVHLGAIRGDGDANVGLKQRMDAVLVHGFRQIWLEQAHRAIWVERFGVLLVEGLCCFRRFQERRRGLHRKVT